MADVEGVSTSALPESTAGLPRWTAHRAYSMAAPKMYLVCRLMTWLLVICFPDTPIDKRLGVPLALLCAGVDLAVYRLGRGDAFRLRFGVDLCDVGGVGLSERAVGP